ncbi:hypothetical protein [Laspinema palackyanum]
METKPCLSGDVGVWFPNPVRVDVGVWSAHIQGVQCDRRKKSDLTKPLD